MSVHKTALLGATTCAMLASASLQAAEAPKALGAGEGAWTSSPGPATSNAVKATRPTTG